MCEALRSYHRPVIFITFHANYIWYMCTVEKLRNSVNLELTGGEVCMNYLSKAVTSSQSAQKYEALIS